ncbi:MAG TPA: hypothetical protein VGJ68_06170 [Bradyrhizobium sp.]|jgi:hypothetical protein
MNLRWLGPLALLAVLVIVDQIRINRPGHKNRLTVEVETPEGTKSASGILAVQLPWWNRSDDPAGKALQAAGLPGGEAIDPKQVFTRK